MPVIVDTSREYFMNKLAAVLAGVWLGFQIGAGYVTAPLLFQNLERMQAGALAGVLFDVAAYFGLAVWLLVYTVYKSRADRGYGRAYTPKWIVLLLVLLAANQFLLTPVIEAHKNGTANWLLSLVGGSFGQWHGASSVVYMVCSIIGLGLVFRLLKLDIR